jgi:hypothetical protein
MADREHLADCPRPGFRYGAVIRRTKTSIASGSAGKIVMLCKNPKCPATRTV